MRSRVRYALWVAMLGSLLAVIPLVSSSAGSTSATISGETSLMWSPMEVTIPPGGTVEFRDTSTSVPHGVVWSSVPETPKCEGVPINEGRTNWKGTCVFVVEGVYDFYCYVHGAYMSGKVIVSAGGTTTTTSTTKSSTSTTKTSTTKTSTTSHSTTTSTSSKSSTSTSGGSGSGAGGTGGKGGAMSASEAFLAPFSTVSDVASTMPGNGDVNPYGVVAVPTTVGKLHAGEILVSNFNDKANMQGTGSTIEQISPSGKRSQFAALDAHTLPGRCPGGIGLTTALGVLPGGYVVVGSLPTSNGKSASVKAGCLIVLNSKGRPVETIAGPKIQGPWDMTLVSHGARSTLFLSTVLAGGAARAASVGTVLRVRLTSHAGHAPKVLGERVIADGIPCRPSPEALVVGPTGLGLGGKGTLYLADTAANRITAISKAMTRTTPAAHGGRTVSAGGKLMEPLGLAIAPNGDILTANAGDGNIVETTPSGQQLLVRTVDTKTGAGSLFGLTVVPGGKGVYFVDDGENTLSLLHR